VTSNSASQAKVSWALWDWCFALVLVIVVPLIYLPYAFHNLPVVAHVDERTSLLVLKRFHDGSLNPQFFMYPSLYYYVTYFLTALFPFSKVLFYGRLLNLSFVGLTAAITYSFCRRHLDSRPAGVVAALCIVGSTTITNSAAYLCTDVLMASATMAALFYLVEFFHYKGRREWLMGMFLLGCAVSCKYTAFLLFISYGMTEILLRIQNRREETENDTWLGAKVPRIVLVCILLGCGLIALVAALAFPTTAAMNFVAKTRTNPDLKDPALYLAFFHHIRLLLVKIAILSVAAAILIGWFKMIYEFVALKRLYYGLGIVVLVSIIATPYSLITPKRFLYDLGALARTNVIVTSSHAQWGDYASWLVQNENMVLLVLSAIGLGIVAFKKESKFLVVAVYLVVSAFVIGSAHVGYARYLTPLLPTVYCAAGAALTYLWDRKSGRLAILARLAIVVLAVIVLKQVGTKIVAERQQARGTDADFASYQAIISLLPDSVLYAGDAPGVELGLAGIQAKQVSWATLGQKALSAQIGCNQALVFDTAGAARNQLNLQPDAGVVTVLSDPRGHGQQVFRRSNCP
jgi:hypothetical protein